MRSGSSVVALCRLLAEPYTYLFLLEFWKSEITAANNRVRSLVERDLIRFPLNRIFLSYKDPIWRIESIPGTIIGMITW